MSIDPRPKWTNSQSNIEAPTDRPFCSHPMKQVCWIMDVLDRFVQYDECGLEMKRFCRGQDELGAWIWRRRHVHLPKAKGATKWMEESLGWVLWSNSPRREQSFSWKAPQFSLLPVNFANQKLKRWWATIFLISACEAWRKHWMFTKGRMKWVLERRKSET